MNQLTEDKVEFTQGARVMQTTFETLTLRVNGQIYDKVVERFEVENGYPGGPVQLVVMDPQLGDIVLSNDCLIELKEKTDNFKRMTIHALRTKLNTAKQGF